MDEIRSLICFRRFDSPMALRYRLCSHLDPQGQNFFTLTGGPFSFITFDVFGGPNFNVSLQDVSDVKQVRIGGTAIVRDPLPGSSERG